METAETIMKTWMRRVWNELDRGAIDELMAADAVVHGLGSRPLGLAEWKQFHEQFVSAFTGFQLEVVDQIVSGDRVAARFEGSMSHAATGQPVTVYGMIMGNIRDGKLIEGWNVVDFLPMLTELGSVPRDAMTRALARI